MSTSYRWIEEIEGFKAIADDWDRAVEASGSFNPFLLSDFIITWDRHFGSKYPPRILVAADGGRIIGGLPLCLKRGSGPYSFARILSYMGGVAANYTEPLYADKGINMFEGISAALAGRGDWDVIYLSDIRQECRLVKEIPAGSKQCPFSVKFYSDHSNWAIDLSGGADNYLSSLSSKMRRDLRSKRKHLEGKFGPFRLQQVSGKEEVEKYFGLYSEYSLAAFAKRGRESSFENRQYADFFRDFLCVMDGKKRLDAHVLFSGDEPLAISFGYRFGPGFNWVLTGFNYGHKYYRPGYLLIEELIKLAVSRGDTHYNWYGYERFYKSQWCNDQSPLYRLFMAKRSLKGKAYRLLNSLENALRSNKVVVAAARKLRRS